MTIGELAQQCGVSRDALRFYERERLLAPPRRSSAGYRLYGASEVARVQFIRRAQATGLTLDDIRELIRVQHLQQPEHHAAPHAHGKLTREFAVARLIINQQEH